MARPATPDANDIRRRGRQRLIGAVTLVALLVVFVPMLLDSEPRQSRQQQPTVAIPPKENAPALTPPAPAAVVAPAAVAPGAAVAAAPSPAISKPGNRGPSTPAAPVALAGFAVQVGAFRDEAKLTQAREKLAAAGVVHYTEKLETKSGPLTRLRAGPFADREAAETALVSIKRGALDGKVVPLP